MSEHLTQERIYAYLDDELQEAELAATRTHLAACSECTLRVQLAAALFEQLESLPEEPLEVDLSPGVLERLEPATGWLPRLALGELLAALAIGSALLFGLGSGTVSTRLIEAGRETVQVVASALQGLSTSLSLALPVSDNLQLNLGASAIWTVAVLALALWVLGNGLVLRRVDSGRSR